MTQVVSLAEVEIFQRCCSMPLSTLKGAQQADRRFHSLRSEEANLMAFMHCQVKFVIAQIIYGRIAVCGVIKTTMHCTSYTVLCIVFCGQLQLYVLLHLSRSVVGDAAYVLACSGMNQRVC